MLFKGNSGTGKTTIARIIANILYNLGYIKENKLIEVDKKDLIAEYLGQTPVKTAKVIQSAMGGVLFIDEAYSIVARSDDMYGAECIATLLKTMEDHKNEFVVIFAGYKQEMEMFADSNPGLFSRIGYTFDFNDYSEEELYEIFKIKLNKYEYGIEPAAIDKVTDLFATYSKNKNFGNGRFVDNVLQKALISHAVNTEASVDPVILMTISNDDIPDKMDVLKEKPRIGFNS